ncbi:hypothetical protein GCM10009647_062130 [Streptomyces sanglieri]
MLISALSYAEAGVLGLATVSLVFVLLYYPDLALGYDDLSVGSISGETLFVSVSASIFIVSAVFVHWYAPSSSPWLPSLLLVLAAVIVGLEGSDRIDDDS